MSTYLRSSVGKALVASGLGLTLIGGLIADDSQMFRADRKVRGATPANRTPAYATPQYVQPGSIDAGRQAYRSYSQDAGVATPAPAPAIAPIPAPVAQPAAAAPAAPAPQAYRSYAVEPSAAAPAVQYYQPAVRNSRSRSNSMDAGRKIRGLGQ